MKVALIFGLIICKSCLLGYAQLPPLTISRPLTGTVYNRESRQPLQSVRIQIFGSQGLLHKTVTDSLGSFDAGILKPGAYLVRASLPTYKTEIDSVIISKNKSSLRIMLTPLHLQTIRGRVVDAETKIAMSGATVVLRSDSLARSTSTDAKGYFRFDRIPVGRYTVSASFVGYRSVSMTTLLGSSSEEVLMIEVENVPTKLNEVEIKGQPDVIAAGTVVNLIVNILSRLPGVRFEPQRAVSTVVQGTPIDDSRNDVIVRGNAPGSVLWRLEGVNIPNPNHFSIPGTSGGPVSMLNDKMLDNSAFYLGAFPAMYGNTTSGIFDISLREGNNQESVHRLQVGTLGIEYVGEGPLKKGESSLLFSSRYATIGLFQKMGLDIGTDARPSYGDLSFKATFHGKSEKTEVSLFGLGGKSSIDILLHEGIKNFYGEKDRDQYFDSDMGVTGITFRKKVDSTKSISSTLAVSGEKIQAYHELVSDAETVQRLRTMDNLPQGQYPAVLRYDFREARLSYSMNVAIKTKKPGVYLNYGVLSDYYTFHYYDSVRDTDSSSADFGEWRTRWDAQNHAVLVQPYFQLKRVTSKTELLAGLHSQYFSLNNSYSILEPRIAWRYFFSEKHRINMGLGLHSQMQSPYLYFYSVMLNTNDVLGPVNRSMDFTRSVQGVLGYEHVSGKDDDWRVKAELYYQWLYNVPVDRDVASSFSLLNTGATFTRFYPNILENSGQGKNYGVEFIIDKALGRGLLVLFSGTLYESLYTGSDGIWRNTDFNGNFMMNALGSYEWQVHNKNILSIGSRVSYAGGRRYGPVDSLASVKQKEVVFADEGKNTLQFKNYFRWDVRFTYTINRKKVSHQVAADLINILNTQNLLRLSFNPQAKNGPIVQENQLGFLPFVYYRLEF